MVAPREKRHSGVRGREARRVVPPDTSVGDSSSGSVSVHRNLSVPELKVRNRVVNDRPLARSLKRRARSRVNRYVTRPVVTDVESYFYIAQQSHFVVHTARVGGIEGTTRRNPFRKLERLGV